LSKKCNVYRPACEVTLTTFTALHYALMLNTASLHRKMELFVSGVYSLVHFAAHYFLWAMLSKLNLI